MQVVELVLCARNKWGNWNEFWFYVAEATVEGHEGLPMSEMCSHYYSAYPPFEVAEEDADEGALQCAAGQSSGRDLVEEFVAYGVWPLAHGWALGEVCPRQMPFHGGKEVRSPAFALSLRNRDPAILVVSRWPIIIIFFNSKMRCRVGRRPACYGCAWRGDRDGDHSAEGEGRGP
jgi:hypothetical protein